MLPDIGQNFVSAWILGSVGKGKRTRNGFGDLATEIRQDPCVESPLL